MADFACDGVATVPDAVAAHAVAMGGRVVVAFYEQDLAVPLGTDPGTESLDAKLTALMQLLEPDVDAVAVNIAAGSVLARVAQVSAAPALVAFTGTRQVFRHIGDTDALHELAYQVSAALGVREPSLVPVA